MAAREGAEGRAARPRPASSGVTGNGRLAVLARLRGGGRRRGVEGEPRAGASRPGVGAARAAGAAGAGRYPALRSG
jgi:hypothetical protein